MPFYSICRAQALLHGKGSVQVFNTNKYQNVPDIKKSASFQIVFILHPSYLELRLIILLWFALRHVLLVSEYYSDFKGEGGLACLSSLYTF